MNLNIEFADGNKLISYDDDTESYSGCPTCDYGSEYINNIDVETTNYRIKARFNQMYEFAFHTSDAIRIFAVGITHMTEEEFVEYLKTEFEILAGNRSYYHPKFEFDAWRKE